MMGAGILFQHDIKVLLLKRSKVGDKWAGYWDCPGGSEEKGESRYETALRESREEIGPLPMFQVYDHMDTYGYSLFLAQAKYEFSPLLNEEHSEWMWVNKEDVLSYKLHPKDKKLLVILYKQILIPPKPIPPEES